MVQTIEQLVTLDKQTIRAKLIDQLLRHGGQTLVASQGVAVLAYWVITRSSKSVFIDGWIIAFTIINIGRLISLVISRRKINLSNAKLIARYYQVGAFFGGISWALVIFSYDPSSPLVSQLFLLIALVGMPAASLASNAIYFPVFLSFAIPVLLSMLTWCLFFSAGHQLEFSLMALVYSILIIHVARKYATNLKSSIEREEENQILVREIKAANVQLHKLAYKDPLTNLSNRRQFEQNAERLMHQLESVSTSLVLMLVDIDNFKTVNDTFGHEAGDQLLKEISSRIKSSSRQSELIAQSHAEAARIGGDEFVVMYYLDAGATGIKDLAGRILHDISEPFPLADTLFKPSVSIGVGLAPQHATKVEELLRIADVAMYQAKEAGGNQFVIASGNDEQR